MKIITFDAYLIEYSDLESVHEHIIGYKPCVAYYKITYPTGNAAYFVAVADGDKYMSISIGQQFYEMVLRMNQ